MVLHLQKYKRAFTDVNVWRVIVDKLAEVIQAVNCVNAFTVKVFQCVLPSL